MIYGVQIDNINTLHDWGLILLADLSIGAAVPKTKYIEVPEADGQLDITEALTGDVTYQQREITFTLFAGKQPGGVGSAQTEQETALTFAELNAYCNGHRRKLWLPDDPEHYFIGRMSVGEKANYNSGIVSVEMLADPWRLKNTVTIRTVNTPGTHSLPNEGRRVCPVITSSGAADVVFGGKTYHLDPGDNQFDDFIFTAGTNTFNLQTSNVSVTFTYQEGRL